MSIITVFRRKYAEVIDFVSFSHNLLIVAKDMIRYRNENNHENDNKIWRDDLKENILQERILAYNIIKPSRRYRVFSGGVKYRNKSVY